MQLLTPTPQYPAFTWWYTGGVLIVSCYFSRYQVGEQLPLPGGHLSSPQLNLRPLPWLLYQGAAATCQRCQLWEGTPYI